MILLGAVGVIVRSHPVHAALSLVLTLFGVAVLFVAQDAHFLAAVQVIVYGGAIVVLFLFVIMLLGVDRAESLRIDPVKVQRPLAAIVGLGLVGLIGGAIVSRAARCAHAATGSRRPPRPDTTRTSSNSPTICSAITSSRSRSRRCCSSSP